MSEHSVPFKHPWEERPLQAVADVIVGGTPSTGVPSYWSGDVPWMSSGDVHLKHIEDVSGRISQKGLASSNAKMVAPRAVVIALAGQGKTRGTVATIEVPLCGNQSVAFLKPKPGELCTDYLFHNLEFRYWELRARSAGGGRAGLSKGILQRLPMPLPQPEEQCAIATILTTIDEAIARTQTLIAKHRRFRTGLMQDLLTKGIDAGGRVRSEETHEFKDSSLGRIPIEWHIQTVGDIAGYVGSGVTPRGGSSVYTYEGVVFLRSQNVYPSGLRLDDVAYIPDHINTRMARSEVHEDDVLLNITGASIGRCTYVPKGFPRANVNQHVCILRLSDGSAAKSLFVSCAINSHWGQKQIVQFNAGSNREGLNYQQVRNLTFAMPRDSEEFERIADSLLRFKAIISGLEQQLGKLRRVKAGLMQDLLTGSVSVPEAMVKELAGKAAMPALTKANAVDTSTAEVPTSGPAHNWEFGEAVLISVLTSEFGSEKYPLGRKRYTKMSYLFHRYHDAQVNGYLKKAAGPYNPATKYKGPEGIAQKNGYIRWHKSGKFAGFVAAGGIDQAREYFTKWHGEEAVTWLRQLKYTKNDVLELWATVDMAMAELAQRGDEVTVDSVRGVIENAEEWQAKLNRDIFSNENIAVAIEKCRELFGGPSDG